MAKMKEYLLDRYEREGRLMRECDHSWYDNTKTLEVICELCGVEKYVGKDYWSYLEEESK